MDKPNLPLQIPLAKPLAGFMHELSHMVKDLYLLRRRIQFYFHLCRRQSHEIRRRVPNPQVLLRPKQLCVETKVAVGGVADLEIYLGFRVQGEKTACSPET